MKKVIVLAVMAALFSARRTVAQLRVTYGDGVHNGRIRRVNQIDQYGLINARQGDVLRVTFGSEADRQVLTVKRGTTSIGSIVGHGVLTAKIPTAGIYWIEVRARNNSWSGSYAFELDRLNDPVSGDRTAFGWNMSGAIRDWADFRCYQIRAARGAKAKLSLASSADRLYAEILDASGKRLCVVVGHGGSVCTFPKDGIYVVFVAARNWTWIGGFGVSVICQTLPCDCAAYSGNYGRGGQARAACRS